MDTSIVQQIKARAHIAEVWSALGGGQLRKCRGRAWWRGGDGHNVALYAHTDTWFDFATGDGGDVIALVEAVRQCGFREAIEWLADFVGVPLSGGSNGAAHVHAYDPDRDGDLERATFWSILIRMFAEDALASLEPWDPQRRVYAALLTAIDLGDESLLDEYRSWRWSHPQLTAAMVRAGRVANARKQARLARWIRRTYGPAAA
jgi:hypothetical protein